MFGLYAYDSIISIYNMMYLKKKSNIPAGRCNFQICFKNTTRKKAKIFSKIWSQSWCNLKLSRYYSTIHGKYLRKCHFYCNFSYPQTKVDHAQKWPDIVGYFKLVQIKKKIIN